MKYGLGLSLISVLGGFTLLPISLEAAPIMNNSPSTNELAPSPSMPEGPGPGLESMSPAKTEDVVPPEEELLIATRRIARKATVASVGIWNGSAFSDGEFSSAITGSIHQLSYDEEDKAWDWGLELLSVGMLGVNGGRRWLFSTYKNYEPYFRVGGGSLWKSSEALASVVNIYRYQLRLGIGLEDLFSLNRSFRTEFTLAWGLPGLSSCFTMSLAF